MNKIKKFAIGTIVAAAAGYVAGILTAPKSGKETRSDIKDTAKKGIAEAEKQLKQLHGELDKLVEETKLKSEDLTGRTRKELDDLVEKAKDSKDKAHDMLSAFRGDGTDDKDLKKAIGDATKAIEHLRNYLSK